MSKTATRRASGRSAEELQAAVERFLKASRKPALLEPGEPIIPITGTNCLLDVRNARFTVQAWDDQRNVVRRVVDIQEETRGRLELVAERFAGKRGALYLIDLARPAGADWERRGTRLVFREKFRQFLSREYPAWRIAELSTERDLEAQSLARLSAGAAQARSSRSCGHRQPFRWPQFFRCTELRVDLAGLSAKTRAAHRD